jgi:segregation and condensation protein B
MSLKNIIEALLFASQKPLMPHEIVAALRTAADDEDAEAKEFSRVKEAEIAALLQQLKLEYIAAEHAFQLVEQVNGWHVVTAPEYGKWVRRLYPESKPSRLSGPALETLAIVAYRQPITKADIEAVRGVAVDGMMQTLWKKDSSASRAVPRFRAVRCFTKRRNIFSNTSACAPWTNCRTPPNSAA